MPSPAFLSSSKNPTPLIFSAAFFAVWRGLTGLPSGSTTCDAGPGEWSAIGVVNGRGEGAVVSIFSLLVIIRRDNHSRFPPGPRASVLCSQLS